MRIYYCPICGKEEVGNDNLYDNEKTIVNIRDGYGRSITHYKCECGNYLAGSMSISGWDESMIAYCKDVIKGYNKGGCFYANNFSLDGDDCDFFEKAKRCYEKRKEDAKQMAAKLLEEIHWFEQCDKSNGDKCTHSRCKYSTLVIEGQGKLQFFCGRE